MSATLVRNGKILPVFEPVKVKTSSILHRAKAFKKSGLSVALVLNPKVGELSGNYVATIDILQDMRKVGANVVPALIVDGLTTPALVTMLHSQVVGGESIYLHEAQASSSVVQQLMASPAKWNLFNDGGSSAAYQQTFSNSGLLRDSFSACSTNASYPAVSFFTEAHLTYKAQGHFGFADFTPTASQFSDGGGPAYAVAIHVTEDRGSSGGVFCNHFISVSNTTPANPAGKFGEALGSLVAYSNNNPGKVDFSAAYKDFLALHTRGHFPGLGEVKRLSIQHHLELMAKLV